MLKNRAGSNLGYLVSIGAVLLAGFLVSCGGGTDGSGVRSFEGQVFSVSAEPLAGATVTIEETGDSATTDVNGEFEIHTGLAAAADTATFVVETGSTSVRGELVALSSRPATVAVVIVVDEARQSATVVPVSHPTPSPTPQQPQASPTAAATARPQPTPPGTPTATPAPAVPTTTPTATPAPMSDACRCDVNRDTYVNSIDFTAALNQFSAGNFDFDGNGSTQLADLQEFRALCDPLTDARCL